MKRIVLGALLCVGSTTAFAAELPLSVVPADGCPTKAQVLAELARLLPSPPPSAYGADIVVVDRGDRFDVDLAGSQRSFAEPTRDCADRARTAAVAIAVTLAPPAGYANPTSAACRDCPAVANGTAASPRPRKYGFVADAFVGPSLIWKAGNPNDDDDSAPTTVVGVALGLFLGARIHHATLGVLFQHDQIVTIDHGSGFAQASESLERIYGDFGWQFQLGKVDLSPHVALGYFTAPGVAFNLGLAADWYASRWLSIGGRVDFDLVGIALPGGHMQAGYGTTTTFDVGLHL